MKKKHLTNAKKTLSVFLSVLMLLTCWVFVAPEKAEAATEIALSYPVTINFNVTTELKNGGNVQVLYKKVMSDGTLSETTYDDFYLTTSFSGSGCTAVKDGYSLSANCPGFPVEFSVTVGSNWNSNPALYMTSFYVGNKNVLNGWVGTVKEQTRTWRQGMTLDNITMNWPDPTWGVKTALPSLGEIQVPTYGTRTISPASKAVFYDQGYNVEWPQSYVTYSQSNTGVSISHSGGTLNSASVTNAALSHFTDATGKKNVTVTASGPSGKTSSANLTLVAPKKDLLYENLFSFSDWYYSDSSKYNDSNLTFDVDNGSFTINNPNTDASTEYTTDATTGTHPAGNYSMPVTAGKTYYFTWKTANASSTEVFFMWKKADGSGISYPSKYFSGDGTHWVEFTAPTDATQVELRFDNNTDATKVTFSNIAVYEKERADAIGIKEWTTRPIREAYTYNGTSAAASALTAAARTGYTFTGWTDINGNAYAPVSNMKANQTVYANFTINTHTVKYIFANGTEETRTYDYGSALDYKPANTTRNPDATYHYTVKWDKEFTDTVTEDATYTEQLISQSHTFGSWTTTTPTSCTAPGAKYRTCTACGYVENAVIPQIDHTLTKTKAVASTCTQEGNIDYWTCSECGKYFSDEAGTTEISQADTVIEKEDHIWNGGIVPGTSTGNGEADTHEVKCLFCDATNPMTHDFYPVDTTTATCSQTGDTYMECDCGANYKITGQLAPDNHVNTEIINKVAAECEKPGYSGDKHCKDCDKIVEYGSETAALEHVYTKYVYNDDAECGVNGTETATCDLCGIKTYTRTKENSALEHVFTNYVDNNNATCDKEGTKTAICDNGCGETDTQFTGKKREHKFDGTIKNNGDGTHSFECSYDDCAVYSDPVNCSSWIENETAGKCECDDCGYTKGHDWDKWTPAADNTDEAEGKMERICKDCSATETTDCDYEQTAHSDATCTAPETTTYTCSECGHGYTVIGESAKGHTYKYDNTGSGTHKVTCEACDYEKDEECSGGQATCTAQAVCQYCKIAYGELIAHKYDGNTYYEGAELAEEATCTAQAEYYVYCSVCKKSSKGEAEEATFKNGDLLPHDYTGETEYLHKATEAKCGVNETYYKYCSACDASSKGTAEEATFEKPNTALTHNYDGTAVCNDDGTHTLTCQNSNADGWVCDVTKDFDCADTADIVAVNSANCTEAGNIEYICMLCDYEWSVETDPALGHEYTEKIYNDAEYVKEAANCDHGTIYWYGCKWCDANGKDETDTEKYTTLFFENPNDKRAHDFKDVVDDAYLAVPATCLAAAKYYPSCSYDDCDAKNTTRTFSSGTALGHDWVHPADEDLADYLVTPADCVNDATYYYVCSRADVCGVVSSKGQKEDGETWTKENSKSGHNMSHTEAAEADCLNPGNLEYWYCDTCKKYYKDEQGNEAYAGLSATVIPKLGHDKVSVAFKAPTCETNGSPEYEYCTRCDYTTLTEDLDDYKATGHNFTGAYYYDTFTNYHSQYCINDNCDKVTLIDAEGTPYQVNSFGMVIDGVQVKYEVTFNEDDEVEIKGGVECTFTYKAETKDGVHSHANACVCGNNNTVIYSDEQTFVETVAATCTSDGYDSHKCPDEECGATWKKNIVKTEGHKLSETATSNGDGTHSFVCTVCNAYKGNTAMCSGGAATCKDQAVCDICKAPYGETGAHTYTEEWKYQEDAACGVNGTEKNTCDICETEVTREAKGTALKHEMSDYGYEVPEKLEAALEAAGIVIKVPNCNSEGMSISYCSRCDYYVTNRVPKDKSTHVWITDAEGNEIWTAVSGNCATGVTYVKTCELCGTTESKVENVGHAFETIFEEAPTCEDEGYRQEKCTVCGKLADYYYNEATGENPELAPLGHSVSEWEDGVVTCKENKYQIGKCATCDKFVIEEFDEKGDHSFKTVAAVKATCEKAGHNEYEMCTVCGLEEGKEVYTVKHEDKNGDGKCEECNRVLYDDGEGSCGCICHKENFIMRILYKILNFFWKLFKISKTCACGYVHW